MVTVTVPTLTTRQGQVLGMIGLLSSLSKKMMLPTTNHSPASSSVFFTIRGDYTNFKYALVHPCSEQVDEGEVHSSFLTDKWKRDYQSRGGCDRNMLFPKCCLIYAESIERPEFVVENTPGLREHIIQNEDSETMILVQNLMEYWPAAFFSICNPGME